VTLERDGPTPTLEDEVRALVEAAGFEVRPDGSFEARRKRTVFRGTIAEGVEYARRLGVDALARKLGVEARNLVVASERNRFLERRAGGVYEREMRRRAEALGLGEGTVRPVESEGDERSPGGTNEPGEG
jgi:hypothetical protein